MTAATTFQRPHVAGMPLIVMDAGTASAQARQTDILLYLHNHPCSSATQIWLGTGHPAERARDICERLVREGRLEHGPKPTGRGNGNTAITYRPAGARNA